MLTKGQVLKTSYILIDFENVQPTTAGALDEGAFKIKVFIGAKQARILLSMASALQALGKAVEYIQVEGSGKNAMDFHIVYYIGRLSVEDPGSDFHIVSNDKGFDPLIAHLKKLKISCQRWSAITDIARAPVPRTATAKPAPKVAAKVAAKAPSREDLFIDNLKKRMGARPATLKTLRSSIKAHFRADALSDPEVESIVDELQKRGKILLEAGKMTYLLT